MSNHHHKRKSEQIYGQEHGQVAPSSGEMIFKAGEAMKAAIPQAEVARDDSAVQLRAYQIYREKGGYALDNWLEAEKVLR